MKKLFILSIASLILAVAFAFGVEKKVYNTTLPGETYFIRWDHTNYTSTVTLTNKESEMWYPSKVGVYYVTASKGTTTLERITVIATDVIASDTVTTNDSGTVTTNHFHGAVTNTTYAYLTNTLCTITNDTAANYSEATADMLNMYIQRNDVLRWTFLPTSDVYFCTIGNR
jgi:hypothetical protein